MTPGTCTHCHRPLRPRDTRATDHPGTICYAARGLCSTCYKHDRYGPPTRTYWPWPDLLAELQHIGPGDPNTIAQRLGTTTAAITRAAYRHGHTDIARAYSAAQTRARRATP